MIETKLSQCLQIQIHDEDDVAKFHGQWCQMLQIDPEALVLRYCFHPLQRVDHLSLSIGQSQCYDMDDMLIGNHSNVYCCLRVVIFEIAPLSQVLMTYKRKIGNRSIVLGQVVSFGSP